MCIRIVKGISVNRKLLLNNISINIAYKLIFFLALSNRITLENENQAKDQNKLCLNYHWSRTTGKYYIK